MVFEIEYHRVSLLSQSVVARVYYESLSQRLLLDPLGNFDADLEVYLGGYLGGPKLGDGKREYSCDHGKTDNTLMGSRAGTVICKHINCQWTIGSVDVRKHSVQIYRFTGIAVAICALKIIEGSVSWSRHATLGYLLAVNERHSVPICAYGFAGDANGVCPTTWHSKVCPKYWQYIRYPIIFFLVPKGVIPYGGVRIYSVKSCWNGAILPGVTISLRQENDLVYVAL